jgi:hypothetical protein
MGSSVLSELITMVITKLLELSGIAKVLDEYHKNKRKKEIEKELHESDDAAIIERLNRELFGS